MVGCFITLVARVALIGVWIATPLVSRAFGGNWLWPLLGVIFLPITALVYVLVYIPDVGVTGWGWVWVALGFLLDLVTHGAGAYENRRRLTRYGSA